MFLAVENKSFHKIIILHHSIIIKCEFSFGINMYANDTVPDIFSERFDKFDIYICLYESFADLLEHFIQDLKVKQNYIE